MKKSLKKLSLPGIILLLVIIAAVYYFTLPTPVEYSASLENIPAYAGEPYVTLAGGTPEFGDQDMTVESYEYYSPLDDLGRCGYAMACLGRDLMPTESRESISHVKPSGWTQGQYDFVDGRSLYNRCHLIGFQLAGENDNEKNLITGTRYCNVQGMLPFENMIADYIKETGNHVLYRVTPVYQNDNLVASGVQMEAWSVEDGGEGICVHVYVYNVQPGVTINYATGENHADQEYIDQKLGKATYILNTSSHKFHKEDCAQGQGIKESNRKRYTGDRSDLIRQGYDPSGCCDP